MTGKADWWRGGVIYQVYPRSFQDTNGDGVGDLKGVTRRLGHIASLGVDAVWLSPFFKSPMADMGYDVSDYRAVDPLFGTLADFDALLDEAHRLGLKIIIDQVLSHCSDRHEWFIESRSSRDNPKADWFVWADPKPDGTAPNNWLSVFGGPAWEWDSVRWQYYLHNFLASQPDLNFHNEAVQDATIDNVRFWLERGVDGFRLDAINYCFHDRSLRDNPPLPRTASHDVPETNPYGFQDHLFDKTQPENLAFLKRLKALAAEYGDRMLVGEVGDGERSLKTVAAYTGGGDKLDMCYTFDLLGPEFSAPHIRRHSAAFEEAVSDGWVCWSFSNHDVPRHVSRFARSADELDRIARFSLALIGSLRGSICLYQGEELGLTEADIAFEELRDPYGIRFWPGFKGRDGCRTPMPWEAGRVHGGFSEAKPWLPLPREHLARAVDRQEEEAASVLAFYRDFLAFRAGQPALVSGDKTYLEADGNLLAFTRETGDERLLLVFNFDRAPARWTVPPGLGAIGHAGMPGATGDMDGGEVALEGLAFFCGRIS
ncbi:MAG: alpha-glucosidase family protein [Rhizobiaceae bacterium]|nr:alpha-glucosidase family protein [Rhizobiaceae bacterium]MCV0404848.1 alpha-glucosidase family protein [Rhizobiaceae bacterium]